MSMVLKTVLSMSLSGSLLILVLFVGKQFLKDKVSRQWQYYIWLIVLIRLLIPFEPEISLMGKSGSQLTLPVFGKCKICLTMQMAFTFQRVEKGKTVRQRF